MATAITTQPTDSKRLGVIQLVDPENCGSGEKIDLEFRAYPVPKGELRPGSKADLAVDIGARTRGFYGSTRRRYELRVELEGDPSNSYYGYEYDVFVTGQYKGAPRSREYVLTYDHDRKVIFEHEPTLLTPAVEQMIGAALYYFFIDSKRDDSSSAEIPTLQQWLEDWHEIIQNNVRT